MKKNIIIFGFIIFTFRFMLAGYSENRDNEAIRSRAADDQKLKLSRSAANYKGSAQGEITSAVPVWYPEKSIGSPRPFFIWYDRYGAGDGIPLKFRLTIKTDKVPDLSPVILTPDIFDKYYFYYKIPISLDPGKYEYIIERLVDNKPDKLRYYHTLKYPVTGEFTLDPDEKTGKEDLPPDRLIEYLRLEKENRLVNGYNTVFFSAAGVSSFGIGLLFYKVLEFGLVSKIIYYTAFAASGFGAGAAGYYGYKYFQERNNLHKIVDIERNLSLNGCVTPDKVNLDFNYSF